MHYGVFDGFFFSFLLYISDLFSCLVEKFRCQFFLIHFTPIRR